MSNAFSTHMGFNTTSAGDGGPPGARELLPILPIVFVVSWAVRLLEHHPLVTTRTALAVSIAGAGLIGLPALFWALDHGHRRLAPLLVLGTLAGVTPLLVLVLSALVGVTGRSGPDVVLRLIETGAPIPGMGIMPWLTFVRAELPAAAIGAVSAVIYWMVFLAARVRGRSSL